MSHLTTGVFTLKNLISGFALNLLISKHLEIYLRSLVKPHSVPILNYTEVHKY
jgi:hypothetical protein